MATRLKYAVCKLWNLLRPTNVKWVTIATRTNISRVSGTSSYTFSFSFKSLKSTVFVRPPRRKLDSSFFQFFIYITGVNFVMLFVITKMSEVGLLHVRNLHVYQTLTKKKIYIYYYNITQGSNSSLPSPPLQQNLTARGKCIPWRPNLLYLFQKKSYLIFMRMSWILSSFLRCTFACWIDFWFGRNEQQRSIKLIIYL